MIYIEGLKSGERLAENLEFSSVELVAIPGTPIDALCGSLETLNPITKSEGYVEASLKTNTANGSHTEISTRVATDAAKVLSNVINSAKNTILPYLRECITEVDNELIANKHATYGLDVNIRQIELPSLFSDPIFMDMVDTFRDINELPVKDWVTTSKEINAIFKPENVPSLIATGSTGVDGKVSKYITSLAPESIIEGLMYEVENINRLSLPELVATFMLATGILDGRIDEADQFNSSSSIRTDLLSVRAMLGKNISNKVRVILGAFKRGTIIAPTEPGLEKTISVYGPAYRKWLKADGSPEAMIGYFFKANGIYLSAEKDLSYPAMLTKIYNAKVRHFNALDAVNTSSVARNTVLSYIAGIISTLDPDTNDKPLLHSKLSEALEDTFYSENNRTDWIRRVLCKVFTDGYEVYDILVGIDDSINLDNSLEMHQAIYESSINVVGKWVASQLNLVKA